MIDFVGKKNGGQYGGAHELEENCSALSTPDSASFFTDFLISTGNH